MARPIRTRSTAASFRTLVGVSLAFLCAAASSARATAQQTGAAYQLDARPSETDPRRAGLAGWYDELAVLTDPRAVERLAAERAAAGAAADYVAAGLAWMRAFELTREEDALAAAREAFDEAKRRDAGQAWAHFGVGWTLTHGDEIHIPSPFGILDGIAAVQSVAEVLAVDPESRGVRALRRALDLEPALEPAAIELARVALDGHDDALMAAAGGALRQALAAGTITRDGLVALSRVEAARGWWSAAEDAARRALRRGTTAAGLHALGRALLGQDDRLEEGAQAYLAGTEDLAGENVALYQADARTLFSPVERAAWDALPDAERGAWLRRFWNTHAALATRTTGERLALHFQRLEVARARYARKQVRGARTADAIALDPDQLALGFDDRGLIYIRHGEPDTVIQSPIFRGVPPPNETWVYGNRRGRPELFYFHKADDSPDFLMTGPIPCDPVYFVYGEKGGGALTRLTVNGLTRPTGPDPDLVRYLAYVQDRAVYDPRLNAIALRCMERAHELKALMDGNVGADGTSLLRALEELQERIDDVRRQDLELRANVRSAANRLLRTESAAPAFGDPLDVLASLYTFRGDGETTDVLAAVLLPFDDFTAVASEGRSIYPVELSVVLVDTASGRVARTDTARAFVADEEAPADRFFRTFLALRATPADPVDYRVVARNGGRPEQGAIRGGTIEVPAYAGGRLQVSDLVVAEPGDGRWRRGDVALAPIPTHQIVQDAAFRLFYEVYDLTQDATYATTIRIVPASGGSLWNRLRGLVGGRPDAIELRFEDVATDADGAVRQELRSISASLPPGVYRLEVEVRDPAARVDARRETTLVVNPPTETR